MGKHQIKHRVHGGVLFECAVPAEMPSGQRQRHALNIAVAAGADLAGASLAGASLAGASLAGADLAGADLAGASLAGADLAGADLAGANLAGADLARARLFGANLARTNLASARLFGADLAGAKWHNGIVISAPPIQLFGLKWPVMIVASHMQIGCELHALSEWAAYDDKSIAEMDGRDALRFWRTHKDALLSLAASSDRDPAAEPDPSTS